MHFVYAKKVFSPDHIVDAAQTERAEAEEEEDNYYIHYPQNP